MSQGRESRKRQMLRRRLANRRYRTLLKNVVDVVSSYINPPTLNGTYSFELIDGATATEADLDEGNTLLALMTDTDANDVLTVDTTPIVDAANGDLSLNSDGTFSYVSDGVGATGDSFTIGVRDLGNNVTEVPVEVSVAPGAPGIEFVNYWDNRNASNATPISSLSVMLDGTQPGHTGVATAGNLAIAFFNIKLGAENNFDDDDMATWTNIVDYVYTDDFEWRMTAYWKVLDGDATDNIDLDWSDTGFATCEVVELPSGYTVRNVATNTANSGTGTPSLTHTTAPVSLTQTEGGIVAFFVTSNVTNFDKPSGQVRVSAFPEFLNYQHVMDDNAQGVYVASRGYLGAFTDESIGIISVDPGGGHNCISCAIAVSGPTIIVEDPGESSSGSGNSGDGGGSGGTISGNGAGDPDGQTTGNTPAGTQISGWDYYASPDDPVSSFSDITLRAHPRFIPPGTAAKMNTAPYASRKAEIESATDMYSKAFCYAVFGDTTKGDEVIAALVADNWSTPSGFFNTGSAKTMVWALCYDFTYDRMTAGERTTVVANMLAYQTNVNIYTKSSENLRYFHNDMYFKGGCAGLILALAIGDAHPWGETALVKCYQSVDPWASPKTAWQDDPYGLNERVPSPFGFGMVRSLQAMYHDGGAVSPGNDMRTNTGYESMMNWHLITLALMDAATGVTTLVEDVGTANTYPAYAEQIYGKQVRGIANAFNYELITGLASDADAAALAKNRIDVDGAYNFYPAIMCLFSDLSVTGQTPTQVGLDTVRYLKGADQAVITDSWADSDPTAIIFAQHWNITRYAPVSGGFGLFKDGEALLPLAGWGKFGYYSPLVSSIWAWVPGWDDASVYDAGFVKKFEKYVNSGTTYWNTLNTLTARASTAQRPTDTNMVEYRPETMTSFVDSNDSDPDVGTITAVIDYEATTIRVGITNAQRTIVYNKATKVYTVTDTMTVPAGTRVACGWRMHEEPTLSGGDTVTTSKVRIDVKDPTTAFSLIKRGGLYQESRGPMSLGIDPSPRHVTLSEYKATDEVVNTTGILSLATALTSGRPTEIVVDSTIPAGTPTSGRLYVEANNGVYYEVPYSSRAGSTFTVDSSDLGDVPKFQGSTSASTTNEVFLRLPSNLAVIQAVVDDLSLTNRQLVWNTSDIAPTDAVFNSQCAWVDGSGTAHTEIWFGDDGKSEIKPGYLHDNATFDVPAACGWGNVFIEYDTSSSGPPASQQTYTFEHDITVL